METRDDKVKMAYKNDIRRKGISWFFPLDPRNVGFRYLITVTIVFLAGALAAALLRSELSTSSNTFLSSDTYNRIFTAHGVFMIFFFLLPAIPGVLGNLVLPDLLKIGNFAFPRLNILSWYLYLSGSVIFFIVVLSGGVDTGWTFSLTQISANGDRQVLPAAVSITFASISLICLALNQLVTVLKMRNRTIDWGRLPVFAWSLLLSGFITVLAAPILVISMLLLIMKSGFGFAMIGGSDTADPVVQKQLFWFFGRPALYLMVLPAIGILSQILSEIRTGGLLGKKSIIGSMIAISVLGLSGAGSHLMSSPQQIGVGLFSTILNLATVIPFSLIFLNWIRTLAAGLRPFSAPLLYALSCVLLLLIGGLSGIILASTGTGNQLHNTHFVLAHFHYLLAGCVVMAYLGGLHFWWERIAGHSYPGYFGMVSAILLFVGINLTFFPMFILGFQGMLRRNPVYPEQFELLNVFSTAGMTILLIGYLIPIFYLIGTFHSHSRIIEIPESSA